MAPKLWRGAKIKAPVLKKPAAGKAKGAAPSAIKGLAGFRKASGFFTGAVDKGVSQQNAPLASRAAVLEGLDARLVYIDPAKNSDKYYVLQGLEDTKLPERKPKRCYAYQRWGRTGTGGVCRLQGPMERKKVESHLFKVFKAKTGADWASVKPGEKAQPGKYWLAVPSEADAHAIWEYYVDDGVDRKCNGWYPYESDAVTQVEELHAEHVANKRSSNSTATRFVPSGKFTYCIDLERRTQRNTSTGKERKIRRCMSSKTSRPDPPARLGSSPADISSGLFRADTAATIPASWNDAVQNAAASGLRVKRSASSASSIPGLPRKRAVPATAFAEPASSDEDTGLPRKRARQATAVAVPVSIDDMREVAQSGEIETLKVPVLKSWLSSMGIATSGSKPDLVDRVYSILSN